MICSSCLQWWPHHDRSTPSERLKAVPGDICIHYSPQGVDTIWEAVTSWPVFTFRLIRLHLCKQAPYFHQTHVEFYVTTQMWHTSSALVLINGFSHLTNGRENLSKSILLWSVHNNKRECIIKSASFSWHLSTCQDTEMSILQSSMNQIWIFLITMYYN